MITFDAAAGNKVTSGTSNTYAHTVGVSSPSVLMVAVAADSSVASVTYNGVAATFIAQNGAVTLWYLLNPSVGTFNVVVTTVLGVSFLIVCSASYAGVVSVIAGSLSAATGTTSSNSVSGTTASEVIFDAVDAGNITTMVPSGSETKRLQVASSGFAIGDVAGGGTVNMSWTFGVSGGWNEITEIMSTSANPAAFGQFMVHA